MHNLAGVAGVALLGRDGARVLASYSPLGALALPAAQAAFERDFLALARAQYDSARKGAHAASLGGLLVLFSLHADFYLLVAAEGGENALFLEEFLAGLGGALLLVCGKEPGVRALQRHYCELALLLDGAFDRGLILCTAAEEMVARALMQDFGAAARAPPAKSAIKGLFSLIG